MTKFHLWLKSFWGTSLIYTQNVESDSGKKTIILVFITFGQKVEELLS